MEGLARADLPGAGRRHPPSRPDGRSSSSPAGSRRTPPAGRFVPARARGHGPGPPEYAGQLVGAVSRARRRRLARRDRGPLARRTARRRGGRRLSPARRRRAVLVDGDAGRRRRPRRTTRPPRRCRAAARGGRGRAAAAARRCPPSPPTASSHPAGQRRVHGRGAGAALDAGAAGVGLLRTELPFLDATGWPTRARPRRGAAPGPGRAARASVVVRLLDFTNDKTPPFLAGHQSASLPCCSTTGRTRRPAARALRAAGAATCG